jgi:hypothetical protein
MTPAAKQKGNPWTLLIVTSMLLVLNVIGFLACRAQQQHFARQQAQEEARVAAQIEALRDSTRLTSPDEEAIPDTNRPRGQLSGIAGWAAFYGDLEAALAKLLWVSGFFVLFGLLWARQPRTG